MSSLNDRFARHWQQKKFGPPGGQPVLLALSGGMDSMALAQLLLDHKVPFAAAHCNFGLRAEASDEDEAFVTAWCAAHDIDCHAVRFDTRAAMEQAGLGVQEAARNLRYQWFRDLKEAHGFAAICTAHHADDNAETMLINLCRGAGIAGLHGIPEHHRDVIRPLLFATRQELAAYAHEKGLQWREDTSNHTDDYLRNAIRHQVLPALEQLLPGSALRMLETSRRIGEAEVLYRSAVDKEVKKLLQRRGKDFYIPIKLLQQRKPLATICYELLKPFGFSARQVPFVLDDLLHAESGRYISSATHRLIRNRDFLVLTDVRASEADLVVVTDLDATIDTADGSFRFSRLAAMPDNLEAGRQVAYLDAGELEQPLILRRWKTGDYFYPLGMGMKKKKLSRFFIDQKLSLPEKERVWVLTSANRVVWVAGLRLDERFKVTPATQNILRVAETHDLLPE